MQATTWNKTDSKYFAVPEHSVEQIRKSLENSSPQERAKAFAWEFFRCICGTTGPNVFYAQVLALSEYLTPLLALVMNAEAQRKADDERYRALQQRYSDLLKQQRKAE